MSFASTISKYTKEYILSPINIRHLSGKRKVKLDPNEVVVLCMLRDEAALIPAFLEHYRSLGASHFVFLDNASVDNSREIISAQDDCTLLSTKLPYKHYKVHLKRHLIRRYAPNRWSLLVDADEFFDYPYSNQISLSRLIGYLNRHDYTAVNTPMLDMFSDKSANEWHNAATSNFNPSDCCYYDISCLIRQPLSERMHNSNRCDFESIQFYSGSIRDAKFGNVATKEKHTLTKHALSFNKPTKVLMRNAHLIRNAYIADFMGVLLHYKFNPAFVEKSFKYAQEENYFNNSVVYKNYRRTLQETPELSLITEHTKKLDSIDDLIKEDFLFVGNQFKKELLEKQALSSH